jgi:tetratricopeptide (TPR) repeat protein
VHQTYYDAELAVAADDERLGRYDEAHDNLVSAVWRSKNHLGPKEISTAYYNLGTFYRRRADFKSSVSALTESITYAEQSGEFDELAMGRRYIELATSYAGLDKWESGITYIKEVVPIYHQYDGEEAKFVAAVFDEYIKALTKRGISAAFIPNK